MSNILLLYLVGYLSFALTLHFDMAKTNRELREEFIAKGLSPLVMFLLHIIITLMISVFWPMIIIIWFLWVVSSLFIDLIS